MKNLLLLLSCLPFVTCFAQFGEAQSIDLGGVYPSTGEVADINGDGKLDVIIASKDKNRIFWFENNGDRQFSKEHLLSDELTEPTAVKTADIDMDGDLDILCSSWNLNTIYWFENDGIGNFSTPQIISDNVRTPESIEVSDIDMDGDLDVLSAAYWDKTIYWHENDGTAHFQNQHIVSTEVNMAHRVQAADFDQDGLIDVFAGSYSGGIVAWFKNEGQGIFSEPKLISQDLTSFQDVVLEDVDADGDIDLLIASLLPTGELSLFLNDGTGNFGAPTIIENVANNVSRLQFEDINQDGYKDIISGDNQWGGVVITFNDGNAGFSNYYTLSDLSGYFDVLKNVNVLLVADFTQTGVPDLLIGSKANRFVAVYANEFKESTSFRRSVLNEGIYGLKDMAVGDIDGDGDKDLVMASDYNNQVTWIENTNSNGRFDKKHVVLSNFRNANSIVLEDFDNDGDLDLAMGGFEEPEVVLYTNDGQGNFTFKQVVVEADGVVAIEAGDINGDGDIDLLIASTEDGTIRWKHNNGSGVFGIVATEVTNSTVGVVSVALADIDNDNYMDVIVVTGSRVLFYRNNAGVYENRILIDNNLGVPYQVKIGDIDGDGFLDVISGSSSYNAGALYWYQGNGLGDFEDKELIIENLKSPMGFDVKDLDKDGDLDIVVAVQSENKVFFIPNYGSGFFGEKQVVLSNVFSVQDIVTEDLNGDEYPDFFSYSHYNSTLQWQENQLFNSIRGMVFWDENANNTYDEGEFPLGNQVIHISNEQFNEVTFSNSFNGKFTYYVSPGAYEVSLMPNTIWDLTTTDAYQIETTGNSSSDELFFGLKTDRILHRVIPYLTSSPTRCNSTSAYWLSYSNTGTTRANGSISLQIDDLMEFVSASIPPDEITDNQLTWHFSNLFPTSKESIRLKFQMPNQDHTGEILETQSTLQLVNEEEQLVYTKTTNYNSIVRCSYDPNDKLAASNLLGQSEFAYIEDTIFYTIRFQNTGNDVAFNIRIEDTLDKKLDLTTFHPITASHDYRTELNRETGLVTFYFDDIMLPDSTTNEEESHGFVMFGIASIEGLGDKTELDNTASIFFDFNPPIITNTAMLTLIEQVETDIETFHSDYSIRVFPNPFSDYTTIEVNGLLEGNYQLEVMDILGRKIRELDLKDGKVNLERGDLKSGIVFWRILEKENQQIISIGKLLIQ